MAKSAISKQKKKTHIHPHDHEKEHLQGVAMNASLLRLFNEAHSNQRLVVDSAHTHPLLARFPSLPSKRKPIKTRYEIN